MATTIKVLGGREPELTIQIVMEAIRAGRRVESSDLERIESEVAALRNENVELRRLLEPSSAESDSLPCIAGRILLLSAIRSHWPYFFKSLNAVWKVSLPSILAGNPELAEIEFKAWREDVRICERNPWIITDVVTPTLEEWTRRPNSPYAQLHRSYGWYVYAPSEVLPDFVYTVRDRPQREPGEDAAKCVARFVEHHRQKFSDRIDTWESAFRGGTGGSDRGMMVTHARWTALFIGGATPREIADHHLSGNSKTRKMRDPDKYVRTGIALFSKRIGLFLPKNH